MAEKVSLLRRIWRFFSGLFRFIFKFIRGLVLLWLLLVIGGLVYSFTNQPEPPDQFVLDLNLDGQVVEAYKGNPADLLLGGLTGDATQQTVFADLIQSIAAAKTDSRVLAININTDFLSVIYPGQLFDLAAAISDFKTSGKPVYAHADFYDRDRYLIASMADKVALDPLGAVFIDGYASYQNYYKDALESLGVTANVFRAGSYKSAVEPFLRNNMSAEAKQANQRWLDVLWRNYQQAVTANRGGLDAQQFHDYVNAPQSFVAAKTSPANSALELTLVDELITRRNFEQWLIDQYGSYHDGYEETYPRVASQAYTSMIHQPKPKFDGPAADVVAVLGLDGSIVDYDENGTEIDSYRVANLLDWVAKEDYYKALVIRVNSPGGTISASEHIRRAVLRVQQADKPVVISMSGMAASGGYWISAPADSIIADANTITGSIGVFGVLPTVDKGLNKIGIYSDGVATTRMAGSMNIDRPMNAAAKATMQGFIDHSYQVFLDTVADGREMPMEQVSKVAEGRVWVGADAKENGLVDELGGLSLAVQKAAALAQLEPQDLRFERLRDQQSLLVEEMMRFTQSVQLPKLSSSTGHDGHRLDLTTTIKALPALFSGSAQLMIEPLLDALQNGVTELQSYAYCQCQLR